MIIQDIYTKKIDWECGQIYIGVIWTTASVTLEDKRCNRICELPHTIEIFYPYVNQ